MQKMMLHYLVSLKNITKTKKLISKGIKNGTGLIKYIRKISSSEPTDHFVKFTDLK